MTGFLRRLVWSWKVYTCTNHKLRIVSILVYLASLFSRSQQSRKIQKLQKQTYEFARSGLTLARFEQIRFQASSMALQKHQKIQPNDLIPKRTPLSFVTGKSMFFLLVYSQGVHSQNGMNLCFPGILSTFLCTNSARQMKTSFSRELKARQRQFF